MRYLLLLAVVGCASVNPQAFRGPDGGAAYTMTCSGLGRTLADCYRKAAELCPAGYQIIDQRAATAVVGVGGTVIGAPQHSMAVECK